MKNQIVGMDGKPIAKVDPMQIGIEDLIKMQDITRGHGTGLEMNDLLTVVIFELHRTKQYALKLGEVLEEKERQINTLQETLDSFKPCACESN